MRRFAKALKQRSCWAPKRHICPGADVTKLRRVYPKGSLREVQATFPDLSLDAIQSTAIRFRIFRAKKPFSATGNPIID